MDLNFDLFKIEKNYQSPAKGKVLVSEPFLQDRYFNRSVVLLTEYDDKGAVGFVLNKPVQMSFPQVINDFPDINSSLSFGGPVSTNTLHYIHNYGESIPESIMVSDGIYWGGDFNIVKSIVKQADFDKDSIRFFLGYSSWEPKQLDLELTESSWVITDVPSEIIMQNHKPHFWKEVLMNIGGKYRMWTDFPVDPNMN